jgi:hypothetical protein
MTMELINQEGIKITLEEVNGLKTINIEECDNYNIKYKGKVILENTKEEFSNIPIQIRNKIKRYADLVEIDKNETVFDVNTKDGNYCCRCKTIFATEEKEYLTMNNWLVNPEKLSEEYAVDIEKWNGRIETLETKAKLWGFDFYKSGDGNDYDDLYTLKVPIKDFNMDTVIEFLNMWEKYNKDIF